MFMMPLLHSAAHSHRRVRVIPPGIDCKPRRALRSGLSGIVCVRRQASRFAFFHLSALGITKAWIAKGTAPGPGATVGFVEMHGPCLPDSVG